MFVPPSYFYRKRIAEEVRGGEPELALLPELMPRGGTAVDVGANEGFYAYALADIADRVVAFEPNPDSLFAPRPRAHRQNIGCMTVPGGYATGD
jgi:hypothetical protein